ncbi:UBX domain-containing protein 1-like [Populus alba x Populus x berolinensis]|nr:UBX domain-containing protein 1-like [Populus alba x Populus x berolinensis]
MESLQELSVLEANQRLLKELEGMGFPRIQAAKALHCSGNTDIEAAINWIVDHENEPSIDPMPLIAVNIDIDSPQPIQTTEEMQIKAQELRNQARKEKEDEEKRLEREREKERIRAGKEIHEAKRIAEENERKRYLASRKAEKEEEKRAREKVRQKLEADKNYVSVASVSKVEKLRECLRSLKRSHKDDDARVKRAFQTLLVYVGNVAQNPDREKFRKIRIGNPLFQNRVGRLIGGIEFLELCGFERIEEDKFLFLPRDKVDLAVLNSAGLEIKSAMSNPFFGLLSRA